jgi:uncharacterized protein YeaO (DUF488 family)
VDIRLKRAYEPAGPSDGYRVLVPATVPRVVADDSASARN